MRRCAWYVWMVAVVTLAGCEDPKSGRGFSLPPGDAGRGEQAFVDLQCHACHSVAGIGRAETADSSDLPSIVLGGEVTRVQTYGELVTSIINPSHRIAPGYPRDALQVDGESKMKNYNDVLTVSQLADLVTFLQSKYQLRPYDATDYPLYYAP